MQQLASIASSQLEKQIRRISAVVLALVSAETLINATLQVSLRDPVPVVQIGLFALFVVMSIAGLWLNLGVTWLNLHSMSIFILIWMAPMGVLDLQELGPEGRPWIWWSIGLTVILVGVFSSDLYARLYLPAVSASWLVVQIVTFGEDRLLQASLDAAYFLIFALAVIGLVGVVRQAAARVDSANTEAIQSAIANAKVEAFEKERQKIDALVHDQVLHSLLVAARASSPSEEKSAQLSAENAMRSLALASKNVTQTEFVTSSALISAIAFAAKSLDSRVQVDVPVDSTFNVPSEVAKGITEATIQALDNAIQHSLAKEITLHMLADFNSQLTVIIEDDGLGFRVDRIPRDRIGIKTSIQFRLTSIGGAAEITSKPGDGTLVKLVWPVD